MWSPGEFADKVSCAVLSIYLVQTYGRKGRHTEFKILQAGRNVTGGVARGSSRANGAGQAVGVSLHLRFRKAFPCVVNSDAIRQPSLCVHKQLCSVAQRKLELAFLNRT